jgi:hypothetical protein
MAGWFSGHAPTVNIRGAAAMQDVQQRMSKYYA